MYLNPHFQENRLAVQMDLIAAIPMGLLVSAGPHGLDSDFLPFLLDRDHGERGILRTHLPRNAPQVGALAGASQVMAVFEGPHAYVSPSWYLSTRQNQQAVPTWNFVIASVWGTPRLTTDPDWLETHVRDLVETHEAGRPSPWSLDRVPKDLVAGLIGAIVGVEIEISRIEAKVKASQNKPEQDRKAVARHLAKDHPGLAAFVWPEADG